MPLSGPRCAQRLFDRRLGVQNTLHFVSVQRVIKELAIKILRHFRHIHAREQVRVQYLRSPLDL